MGVLPLSAEHLKGNGADRAVFARIRPEAPLDVRPGPSPPEVSAAAREDLLTLFACLLCARIAGHAGEQHGSGPLQGYQTVSFTSLEYFGGEVRSRSGIGFPCHRCATEQLGFQVVADRTDVRRNFCRGHGVAARAPEIGPRPE